MQPGTGWKLSQSVPPELWHAKGNQLMTSETIASTSTLIQTRLQRPWLIPARILWLTIVLIALGLFTVGLSARYEDIRSTYQGSIQVGLSQNQKGEIVIGTGGPAAVHAGVLDQYVLMAVNDVPVTSVEQAYSLLAGEVNTPVTVTVQTGHFPARRVT